MRRCFSCFREYEEAYGVCPFCGEPYDEAPAEPVHLAPGTVLARRYVLGHAVGAGGFGIVYRAWDEKLASVVAVKEFFVSRIMTRAEGETAVIVAGKSAEEFRYRKDRFLAEARTMARFGQHRSIPNVFEYFEENGTAYIVMELLSGQPLNEMLRERGGKLPRELAVFIAQEVGEALKSLHAAGIIHRDVAPDNIFICSDREVRVKLMDLGAARLADSTDDVIDIILKPGYSPTEQYDNAGHIGPWTDIYALGATLYACLTGEKPAESTNRKKEDTVKSPAEVDPAIPEQLSNTVMKAMAIDRHFRFKDVEQFLQALSGSRKVVTLATERRRRNARRAGFVAVGLLIIAAAIGSAFGLYTKKRGEEDLPKATITVWYSAEEDSREHDAMEAMAEDFEKVFPNVTVALTSYPDAEYRERLLEARDAGKLPSLFESTALTEEELAGEAADLTRVLASGQAKDCYFLDQYANYYDKTVKLPLGIEAPVACIITNGPEKVDFEGTTFDLSEDFWEDIPVARDEEHGSLVDDSFTGDMEARAAFLDPEHNDAPVMFTSTMAIEEVRRTIPGYQKTFAYYKGDALHCRFVYEWSLGEGTADERQAAEKLLTWMLGNVYQNMLMITESQGGEIPVNKTAFETRVNSQYLKPLSGLRSRMVFEKEK